MAGQQEKKPRIALCTHVFENVHFDVYFNHLWCVAHWGRKHELVFVGKSGLQAAKARNAIIETAISRGCTQAFFLDGDHLVPERTLDLLLETSDQAMVAGLVCKRGEEFQQVGWEVHKGKDGKDQYFAVTLPLDGRVYQISVCPFGCTLINLAMLQKLKKPYFRDTCVETNGEIVNTRSDINLCLAFREIGEKVWVDTRVLVGHEGVRSVVWPQGAMLFEKLKGLETEMFKLSEGQQGLYYVPADRRK